MSDVLKKQRRGTLGYLRELTKDLPDDTPLVRSASDHSYRTCGISTGTALFSRHAEITEDHGEEVTPEEDYGERKTVVVVQ